MNPFLHTPSSSHGYHSAVGSNTDPRNNRRSGAFHPVQPPLQDLQQQLFQVNQQSAQSARDYNDGASTLSSHHDSQREEWERNEIVQKRWLDKSNQIQHNAGTSFSGDLDTSLIRMAETAVKQILLQFSVIKKHSFMLEDEPRGCFVTRSLTDKLLPVVRSNGMKQFLLNLTQPISENFRMAGNVMASMNDWMQAASENIASLTEAIQTVTQIENDYLSVRSDNPMLGAGHTKFDMPKLCFAKCQEIKKGFECHREKLQHSHKFIEGLHTIIPKLMLKEPPVLVDVVNLVNYYSDRNNATTVFGPLGCNEIYKTLYEKVLPKEKIQSICTRVCGQRDGSTDTATAVNTAVKQLKTLHKKAGFDELPFGDETGKFDSLFKEIARMFNSLWTENSSCFDQVHDGILLKQKWGNKPLVCKDILTHEGPYVYHSATSPDWYILYFAFLFCNQEMLEDHRPSKDKVLNNPRQNRSPEKMIWTDYVDETNEQARETMETGE